MESTIGYEFEGSVYKSAENVMKAIAKANPDAGERELIKISALYVNEVNLDAIFKIIICKVGESYKDAFKFNTRLLKYVVDVARERINDEYVNSITIVDMMGRTHFYVKKDGNPASWIQ